VLESEASYWILIEVMLRIFRTLCSGLTS